jgi:hypothetical protein
MLLAMLLAIAWPFVYHAVADQGAAGNVLYRQGRP